MLIPPALLLMVGGAAVLTIGMGLGSGRHSGMGGMGGMGGMMGPPPSAGENPISATEDVWAEGKLLYEAQCFVCHGPQGRGDGPAASGLNPRPPDLLGRPQSWSDGQIAAQIQNGRGTMPPFREVLAEVDIWRVVHWVRRLQAQ